jgi:hypothetical protein
MSGFLRWTQDDPRITTDDKVPGTDQVQSIVATPPC